MTVSSGEMSALFVTPFEIVIIALAAYRLTRLVSIDSILDRPRAYAFAHTPDWFTKLVTCPWCIGFWIALVVVALNWAAPVVSFPILTVFAVSAVVGILSRSVDGT